MFFNFFGKVYAVSEEVCGPSSSSALCASDLLARFGLSLSSFWAITAAAFVDSINPCAIAVLLILLGSLLAVRDKKKALQIGLLFCFGLYIAYFLAGLGLFSFFTYLDLSRFAFYIHVIIGVLAILFGLLNIKDFFWYGKGIIAEIPRAWRPTLKKFLKNISSPMGAFLGGFIIILFELPCTGGPYLFTIGYLSGISKIVVVPILIYYNLIFILPLLLIIFLMYFGYSTVEKAAKWKDRNIRILHLIAGLILVGLGIWVIIQ